MSAIISPEKLNEVSLERLQFLLHCACFANRHSFRRIYVLVRGDLSHGYWHRDDKGK